MNLLTRFCGSLPYIDLNPDPETLAMLDQPAACDKHRELVDAAAIEALQARIVANGGTVRKESLG